MQVIRLRFFTYFYKKNMLTAYPTKYGTGIEIYGDYYDFRSLHQVLHNIDQHIADVAFDGDFYMGLAYEVRKAYSGNRLKKKMQAEDEAFYYGFQFSWPDILFTLNILRQRVGYMGSFHEVNAHLFALEHITMEALRQYDASAAIELVKWITEHKIAFYVYSDKALDEARMRHYREKNGKTRFRKLHQHMKLLLPYSREHHALTEKYDQRAKKLKCKVEDLKFPPEAWSEVEFKW